MDWSVCKGNDCVFSNSNEIPKTRATKRVRVAEIKPKPKKPEFPILAWGASLLSRFYSKVRSMLIENMGVSLVATNGKETKERKPKEKVPIRRMAQSGIRFAIAEI